MAETIYTHYTWITGYIISVRACVCVCVRVCVCECIEGFDLQTKIWCRLYIVHMCVYLTLELMAFRMQSHI